MGAVRIRLLGGFAVWVGDCEVPDSAWGLRKARGVVKLLALARGHAIHREVLCETLWPDRDSAAARNNLHQVLYVARRALEAAGADRREVLGLRDELVVLCPAGSVWVDAERFEAAAEAARAAGEVAVYREALGLYGGELLPEDRYEPWVEPRRASLAELRLSLLVELAELESRAGNLAGAVESLRRAVSADPLHELANRALMRALADGGRRQEALAQFERLRSALRDALGADPDPQTRRLYRDLLTGSLAAEPSEPEAPLAPARRHNLPHEPTSFVGRERALGEVEQLLTRTRLLTLSGAGGRARAGLPANSRPGVRRRSSTAPGWCSLRRSPIRSWWRPRWRPRSASPCPTGGAPRRRSLSSSAAAARSSCWTTVST
jgi:DNA-binding SARP family transcriptional activator